MGSTVAGAALFAPAEARSRPRLAFAPAAAAIAVALALLAFAPFLIAALAAARGHRVFLGVDSWDPLDALQYLAWVRDAHHGLIRSLFGLTGGAVFLHPMWSPSGWVQAGTGISDTAIMAFWTAVGAAVLFAGCRHLVVRQIAPERPAARLLALALALFGGLTPLALLLGGPDLKLAGGDLIPAAALWGYVPMAIAVGLTPVAIEGAQRLLAGARDRRTVLGTAAAAVLVGWLHPWQGAALVAVLLGLALWSPRRWRAAAPIAVAAALPIVYYLVLSRIDAGWAAAERADRAATVPGALVALCLAPLVLAALPAARRAGSDPSARGLLLWPFATLLVLALAPSGQDRALAGLGVPVAVLAVRAWPAAAGAARTRLAAAAALMVALVPAAVYATRTIADLGNPYFTSEAELNAADVRAAALAARAGGGAPVLAPAGLGAAIPALTGAPTWVGHPVWTPDYGSRAARSAALFAGTLTGPAARALVRATGTRALVEPCGWTAALEPALAPLGFAELRVGCARVYARRT